MSSTINASQVRAHFSQLLDRVMAGEEIVIMKAGKPVARLLPVASYAQARAPGTGAGGITTAPDFHAPLPGEILDRFDHLAERMSAENEAFSEEDVEADLRNAKLKGRSV